MGSVNEEIERIAGAKAAIEGAIEYCGVDVPDNDKIETYAARIKEIPAAVFSQFNSDEAGGTDKYIKSIKQENGVITATEGELASSSSSGLMSAALFNKLAGISDGAKPGTITSITPGTGLTGTSSDSAITTSGTINLKTAATGEIGGIMIGYTKSGKNYPVELDSSNKAYVNVPWTDNNTKLTAVNYTATPQTDSTTDTISVVTEVGNATGTTGSSVTGTYKTQNVYTKTYVDAVKTRVSTLETRLSTAMRYIGKTSSTISDGSSTNPITIGSNTVTAVQGDVVIDKNNNKEYIWNSSNWEEFGNEGNYKVKQVKVESPTADKFDISFIDTISQDEEGVITATKKTVQSATKDQAGIVTTESQTFAGAKTFNSGIRIDESTSSTVPDHGAYIKGSILTPSLIQVTNSTGNTDLGMTVEGPNYKVGFIIGDGNTNRGIYDYTNEEWIFYKSETDVMIPNWKSKGSSMNPVYFDHTGRPIACAHELQKTVPSDAVFTDTNYYPSRSYSDGLQISTANYSAGVLYVPNATPTQSGVVTDTTQEFGGSKIFKDSVYCSNLHVYPRTTNLTNMYISGVTVTPSTSSTRNAKLYASSYAIIKNSSNSSTCAIYAPGGFYESSDERLKNISDNISVNLKDLQKLRKIYYVWKDDKSEKKQIGLVAQDIQKLYPELVEVDENTGLLSLAYDKLSVIALAAVDKLHEEICSLQKKNTELEDRLSKLENLLLYGN